MSDPDSGNVLSANPQAHPGSSPEAECQEELAEGKAASWARGAVFRGPREAALTPATLASVWVSVSFHRWDIHRQGQVSQALSFLLPVGHLFCPGLWKQQPEAPGG